jgi:GNAT superfamily N-acetyltransferase
MTTDITVRELVGDEAYDILTLVGTRNPSVDADELRSRLDEMLTYGYRCIGAFVDGKLVGVAGFWIGSRFYCGKYIDVDNVVVDEAYRSRGIGGRMMRWLEEYGVGIGCKVCVLDSYVTLAGAHKFYFREGYHILGYHFSKKLDSQD